jgi:hypothetical protein
VKDAIDEASKALEAHGSAPLDEAIDRLKREP